MSSLAKGTGTGTGAPPARRKVAGERSRQRQQSTSATAVIEQERPVEETSTEPRTSRLRFRRPDRSTPQDSPPAPGSASVVTAPDTEAAESGSAARGPLRWWPAVTAVAAACAVLAAVLVYVVRQPAAASGSDRVAAVGSAQSTLETLLSYDFKTYDQHIEQVKPQLAAPFLDEFTGAASTQLKTLATTNQTVVQARVYNVGVMSTTGDTVKVLAFVNQATTTKAKPDPQIDQNRVIATMKQVDGRWLISALDAF